MHLEYLEMVGHSEVLCLEGGMQRYLKYIEIEFGSMEVVQPHLSGVVECLLSSSAFQECPKSFSIFEIIYLTLVSYISQRCIEIA